MYTVVTSSVRIKCGTWSKAWEYVLQLYRFWKIDVYKDGRRVYSNYSNDW